MCTEVLGHYKEKKIKKVMTNQPTASGEKKPGGCTH